MGSPSRLTGLILDLAPDHGWVYNLAGKMVTSNDSNGYGGKGQDSFTMCCHCCRCRLQYVMYEHALLIISSIAIIYGILLGDLPPLTLVNH